MRRGLTLAIMLLTTQRAAAQTKDKPLPKQFAPEVIDKMVSSLVTQLDANKDGKLAKDEAKGRMAENFAVMDKNKDGFLDRAEIRPIAEKILSMKKGPFPGGGLGGPALDFDALDKNADGRLTREEIKGSPLAARLEEIDANQDGRLDRRELEAFLQKEAAKKK